MDSFDEADEPGKDLKDRAVAQAIETIRNRIDAAGRERAGNSGTWTGPVSDSCAASRRG